MEKKLLLALPNFFGSIFFASVAAYCFYLLHWTEEEEVFPADEVVEVEETIVIDKAEIKIPLNAVGAIIGKHGANIKQLQKETQTFIDFKEVGDSERLCVINGQTEGVEKAKHRIQSLVKQTPDHITKEILVDQSFVGRIIGQQGVSIKNIKMQSNTRIDVEPRETARGTDRRIQISGNKDGVEIAEGMIWEIVNRYTAQDELRNRNRSNYQRNQYSDRFDEEGHHRSHQPQEEESQKSEATEDTQIIVSCVDSLPNQSAIPEQEDEKNQIHHQETSFFNEPALVIAGTADNFEKEQFTETEAISDFRVCAITNVTEFWIHKNVKQTTLEIEELTFNMNKYYESERAREFLKLNGPEEVPERYHAVYSENSGWVRVQIIDGYDDDSHGVVFTYLDKGGRGVAPPGTQFYHLPKTFMFPSIKAIKCSMAFAKYEPDLYFEGIQYFEQLVLSGPKYSLYREGLADGVPFVSLYIIESDDTVIDVRNLLQEKGFLNVSHFDPLFGQGQKNENLYFPSPSAPPFLREPIYGDLVIEPF